MLLLEVHMECSICSFQEDIWSTPYVASRSTYGVLHMLLFEVHMECSRCCFQKNMWSTPDIASISTYGVFPGLNIQGVRWWGGKEVLYTTLAPSPP